MENNSVLVYSLVGIEGRSRARLKKHGFIDVNNVVDTRIKTYKITDDIMGDVYACNFPLGFLVSTKKLPMLCVNVYHTTQILRTELISFFLNFVINDNEDAKSLKELEKKKLRGKYEIEVKINDTYESLDKKIEKFTTPENIMDIMVCLTKTEEIISMLKDMVSETVNERKNKAKKEMRVFDKPLEYKNIDQLIADTNIYDKHNNQ